MTETHLRTIKPSRVKYLNYYLGAILFIFLLFYTNTFYSFSRNVFLFAYAVFLALVLSPEILRTKEYHKVTDRNIVVIRGFGQSKRSILHSFILDIHVHQSPILKKFFDVGTVKIESFSGHGITMPHIKKPGEVAKFIQNLMVSNQRPRQ